MSGRTTRCVHFTNIRLSSLKKVCTGDRVSRGSITNRTAVQNRLIRLIAEMEMGLSGCISVGAKVGEEDREFEARLGLDMTAKCLFLLSVHPDAI